MNIYEKMLAITSELKTIAKNLIVGEGKSQYKAVGEADVLKPVRELEEKYKVYSYPVNRQVIETGEIVNKTQYGDKRNLFLRIETTYRFINIEKPEEYIDIVSYGDGVDSQDKAVGKAMTYADKYALMKAYKIVSGDDPDQQISGELQGKSTKPITPRKTPEKVNYRDLLIEKLNVLGLDMKTFAKEKGLNGNSTQDDFKRVCEELNKDVIEGKY